MEEATKDGMRPLHIASLRGHAGLVRWLVRARGADVFACDRRGATPLHVAVLGPSDDVIVTLLRAGADAQAPDQNGVTPVTAAARRRTAPGAKLDPPARPQNAPEDTGT